MRSLERSKVLAKMGRGRQADWAMAKILLSFLFESSYLLEIFSISSSGDSAKLTSKFWPLLNQPARHGPFRPKLWTALATVFVGIFFRKKFWWGSRPIPVAHWKEFWISWKKWRFQIFQKLAGPSNNEVHDLSNWPYFHLVFHGKFVKK